MTAAGALALADGGCRLVAVHSRHQAVHKRGVWDALSHEAHGLLTHLRDHAPEEYRETMIANVPLHREIIDAWIALEGGSKSR